MTQTPTFKEEVVAYGLLEPLDTITQLSESLDIPVGALVRYVLAKWATGGSEGMLHIGGTSVQRMHNACQAAEGEDTDEARLRAYEELRQMVMVTSSYRRPNYLRLSFIR